MSTTELRPLEIGEILDVAIKTFAKNARTLITIGLVIAVPFELLVGVIRLSTISTPDQISPLGSLAGGSRSGDFTVNSSSSTDLHGTLAPDPAVIAGGLVILLIGLIVTLLLTAATLKAVSDAYLGETPSARESLRFALRRVGSLAWLYLVLGVGIMISALFAVLPAIWLWIAWSLATPVLLIEDLRGIKALRRSFRLVRKRWWQTFAVQIVAFLIVAFSAFVLEAVLIGIPALVDGSSVLLAVIASTVAGTLSAALITPLQGAVTAVLYFDLRVRRDGFDIALLAGQLGLPQAALASSAPPDASSARDAFPNHVTPSPNWPPAWESAWKAAHPADPADPADPARE